MWITKKKYGLQNFRHSEPSGDLYIHKTCSFVSWTYLEKKELGILIFSKSNTMLNALGQLSVKLVHGEAMESSYIAVPLPAVHWSCHLDQHVCSSWKAGAVLPTSPYRVFWKWEWRLSNHFLEKHEYKAIQELLIFHS